MPRKRTGAVLGPKGPRGRYSIRFTANDGERYQETVGYADDGYTAKMAEVALRGRLADVERGLWQPYVEEPEPEALPTFGAFAGAWLDAKRPTLRRATEDAYEGDLRRLEYFDGHPLDAITVAAVDGWRDRAVARGVWNASTINTALSRLGQVLAVAEERGLIERNPLSVNPRNRRVRGHRPKRTWLEKPTDVEALLEAVPAGRSPRYEQKVGMKRALLGVLVLGGLRIEEATQLRWEDVTPLGAGKLRIPDAKTPAGVR